MAEVLVIGGGMAGAIAALSALRAGAKVIVARRALGATALSSGAIDVAVDPHARDGVSIEEAAREIARIRRHHPYAILEQKLPRLMESLRFASSALPELLSPPAETNAMLATSLGTVKPTAMAQLSQIGADLSSLPEETAIVEFALNPLFDARLVAAGLQAAAFRAGRTLRIHVVESRWLNEIEDAWKKPAEIARALDNPGALEGLALEIRSRLPPSARMVLLPPVLGRQGSEAWSKLSSLLNLPCAEVLSASFSVPGLRLQAALDAAIKAAGIALIEGEVKRGANGFSIGADRTVKPDGVVVATGRFISGGIAKQGVLRETIFGLPVYVGSERVDHRYLGDWLSSRFSEEQRLFRVGIRIDEELRPLNSDGNPFDPRVYAAGSVIGGYDPAADKTGLGVATFTGFLAGESAAKTRTA
jgi:glycerol-3-phosphate dehydrogenase subunit B